MNQSLVNDCMICDELFRKELSDIHVRTICDNCRLENRILFENDDFAVVPSLGPVSECHILVFSKQHVNSYALLDKALLDKAENLIKEILIIIKKKYGRCVVFEHGILDESMLGSASCNHAHMHIVSCNKSILSYLERENLQLRPVEKLSELTEQKKRNAPYFYYGEDEMSFVMDDIICRSQYMRILLAEILQTPEKGDWKKNPGLLDMQKMLKELKHVFVENVMKI